MVFSGERVSSATSRLRLSVTLRLLIVRELSTALPPPAKWREISRQRPWSPTTTKPQISRQTKESPAKSIIWLPTSAKCSQLWWFLLFFMVKVKVIKRNVRIWFLYKFHEPLCVIPAEASEGLFIEVEKMHSISVVWRAGAAIRCLFFPFSAKTQFSWNLPPSHPISRQATSKCGNDGSPAFGAV